MTSENPYAPPSSIDLASEGQTNELYYTEGKFLMVRNGAILPNRCIKTNQPVEPGRTGIRKKITVSWCHPAWFLLILVNILILLIVALFVSKKAKIEVAISSGVRTKRMIWSFIWIALLFGGIGGFVYGIVDDAGGAIAIGVLSFLIGVIGVLITSRFLTAKTHRDGLFTVKGCHPDFLAEIRRAQQRMPLGERLEKIHG